MPTPLTEETAQLLIKRLDAVLHTSLPINGKPNWVTATELGKFTIWNTRQYEGLRASGKVKWKAVSVSPKNGKTSYMYDLNSVPPDYRVYPSKKTA